MFKRSRFSKRNIYLEEKPRLSFAQKRTLFIKWSGISIIGFLIIISSWIFILSRSLPSAEEIATFTVNESTKILDTNGELLYEIHGAERRDSVRLGDINPYMKHAIIAVEDNDFYDHKGFSLRGITRAAYNSIVGKGGLQGGSTITQQFVKNTYLSPEKRITRKIKEFMLSLKVEDAYTKDQILGMYLNKIPFGSNIYGVESAAQTFFRKTAKDLTIAESAVLAAIPKAPTYLSPYGNNKERLMERKDYAIARMRNTGRISAAEYEAAIKEEIEFFPIKQEIKAPHFVFYVRELLEKKYGKELVERGGLTVETTLDLQNQAWAEEAVAFRAEHNKENWDATNAALVSIDPRNGHILAMMGSADFFGDTTTGQFNSALSERQPGSSFKPFAYAAAFTHGYSPATVVYDVLTDFAEEEGHEYIPENHDGEVAGPVSFRDALAQSLNIPAVKALHLGGIEYTMKLVQRMGITTLREDPDHYGLSLVLGGGGVTLTELTEAFSVFANGGIHHDAIAIKRITDKHGTVIEEAKVDAGTLVLKPGVAYQVSDILSDNGARAAVFGENSWLKLKNAHRAAAKTGTSQEFRDGWTVGYTPFLTTGVWAGNNDNAPMKEGAYGTVVAGPIWNKYMTLATTDEIPRDFYRPDTIVAKEISLLDGKLATEKTPEKFRRYESFVKNLNLPRESENNIRGVVVCRATGNIAHESCPSNYKEIWIYEKHDSLLTIKDNWQEGVDTWAEENFFLTAEDFVGFGITEDELPLVRVVYLDNETSIPTISDKTVVNNDLIARLPKIGFAALKAERILNEGMNDVRVNIKAPQGFKRIDFFLGDVLLNTFNKSQSVYKIEIPEGFVELNKEDIVTETITDESQLHILDASLKVVVYDQKDMSNTAFTPVKVKPESIAPLVSILQPLANTPYSALDTEVYVSVDAKDDSGISRVQFLFDGERKEVLTVAPWNTVLNFEGGVGSGPHAITIVAEDNFGNQTIETMSIIAK